MPSKLMKRKIAWARGYAADADAEIKVLRDAQRAAFRGDTGEDQRQLSLAVSIIEADRRFQVIAVKDGRSPANRRQAHEAHKRLERARAEYARHTGREPDKYGSTWRWRNTIDDEIQALVDRLRTASK